MRKTRKQNNEIRCEISSEDASQPLLLPSAGASSFGADAEGSVGLDLRLIGFEAAQRPSRRRRLGDPVAAADSFELALPDDLHRHPDLPVIRPLCGADRGDTGAVSTSRISCC